MADFPLKFVCDVVDNPTSPSIQEFEDVENVVARSQKCGRKNSIFPNKKLDGESLESILEHYTFKYMKQNTATSCHARPDLYDNVNGRFYREDKNSTMEISEEPMTYFQHNGIIFCSPLHTVERLEWLKEFNIDPNIPVIVTYPKSGTTWMQQVTSLILCNDNDSKKEMNLYARAPWMEIMIFKPEITDYQMLTTHLNYQMVPKCVKNKKFKIIYVTRNPKDVIVSSYYFHKYSRFLETPKDFQDFLEKFVEGNVFYGSWFEHIRDWHSHKDELNILFVAYEDMKNDLRSVVQKVASFLNKKLDEETLESILNQCTFKHMKENPKTNYKDLSDLFNPESGSFFRKGITGDWKNHFLVSQNEWFDSIYQEKMGDFPLKFDNM